MAVGGEGAVEDDLHRTNIRRGLALRCPVLQGDELIVIALAHPERESVVIREVMLDDRHDGGQLGGREFVPVLHGLGHPDLGALVPGP